MGDMKEIRDAALAYYHNLTKEQQLDVSAFFKSMDADGNGTITMKEFQKFHESDKATYIFRDMDKNGDGVLDFEEAITLFYVFASSRFVGCHGCKLSFIKGLYFTCVDCFDCGKEFSYDLCISCYGSRNYVHQHSKFLDNYALLRAKSADPISPVSQPTRSVESVNEPDGQVPLSTSTREEEEKGFDAFKTGIEVIEVGVAIGNVAVATGLCTIM